MSWYRELAGDQVFRCSKCGARRYVKYVPTGELCRSCATKKAGKKRSDANVNIELADNLVITSEVWSRLDRKAEREIPISSVERIGNFTSRWGQLFFWLTACPVANAVAPVSPEYTVTFWLVLLAWALGGSGLLIYSGEAIAKKPRIERAHKVSGRVDELAEERKKQLMRQSCFIQALNGLLFETRL